MKTYAVKVEISAEIKAFNEDDAGDYLQDLFGSDDVINNFKIIDMREK
jgi:hypothetical protein